MMICSIQTGRAKQYCQGFIKRRVDLPFQPLSSIEKHTNNYRLAVATAQLANEVFGDLCSQPDQVDDELIKKRIQYFREIAQNQLNNGEDIHVDVRVDIYKGVVNLDYGRHMGEFSAFDMMSRGLYLDLKGRTKDGVLLLPMPKFFNYGEPECPEDGLIQKYKSGTIKFFEKIDGSMILARKLPDGELAIATRRIFHDPNSNDGRMCFTRAAEKFLLEAGTDWMDSDQSYTFELVFEEDEMLRPVKHAPGLYLLSARSHIDGASRTSEEIQSQELAGKQLPLYFPQVRIFSDFGEATRYVQTLEDTEGFVATIPMKATKQNVTGVDGRLLRIKFKTPWWFTTHRALAAIERFGNLKKAIRLIPDEVNDRAYFTKDDVFSKKRLAEILAEFNVYANDRYAGQWDGLDDFEAEVQMYWSKACEYAQSIIQNPDLDISQWKKALFTNPDIPLCYKAYSGRMIDLQLGRGRLGLRDVLKHTVDVIEATKKQEEKPKQN